MTRMRIRWRRWARAVLSGMALAGVAALPVFTPAAATAAGAHSARPVPTVVILLDTNWSMSGVLPAERQAALDYARALPPGVRVGLVMFGTEWHAVLSPTTDRSRLTAAMAKKPLTGGTSRGLAAAVSGTELMVGDLGAAGRDRLLVISDGEDLTGKAPQALIPADVIPWRIDRDDRTGVLRALASAAGGRAASPAHAAALAVAFPRGASGYRPTARPGGAASRLPVPLIAVLATVFMALFVIALLGIDSLRRNDLRRDLANRIERYGHRRGPAQAGSEGVVAAAAVGWTARLLRSSNTERGLAERLDLAGIARKPAEWALLGACFSVALAAILTVLIGNALIGVLSGVLIGWLGMRLVLSIRIGRRRAAFGEQLPDVLQLVAGSLQSGFSLAQALDAVVRENTQPAAAEFSRALAETRIGADLEVGLEGIANRMDSTDLRWTVMAIRIQREVGGNLAEVLRNTVDTMRERAYIRRHVKALSAEGRFSAYILAALPVAVSLWMFLVAKAYTRPLYTTLTGLLMIGTAAVLFLLGVLWMRAVIKVEV